MELKKHIQESLSENFHVRFNVQSDKLEHYIITLVDAKDSLFKMEVSLHGTVRLIVTAEPEKYAAHFMEEVDSASMSKRQAFCQIWDCLGCDNLQVKINDTPCTKEDVLNKQTTWKKIYLRFSKAPYYDVETENQIERICNYITQVCSMVLSLIEYTIEGFEEGKEITNHLTTHERNPINRQICLAVKGYKCSVCGLDFKSVYGHIGEHFIEVHHSIPVSEMENGHVVDPIKELFPVCSNCHAMLHRKNPPYTIEELKQIIAINNG